MVNFIQGASTIASTHLVDRKPTTKNPSEELPGHIASAGSDLSTFASEARFNNPGTAYDTSLLGILGGSEKPGKVTTDRSVVSDGKVKGVVVPKKQAKVDVKG